MRPIELGDAHEALLRFCVFATFLSAFGTIVRADENEWHSRDFVEALKIISDHGDLGDTAFVASTLRMKFREEIRSDRTYFRIERRAYPHLGSFTYRISGRPENTRIFHAEISFGIQPLNLCLQIADVLKMFGTDFRPSLFNDATHPSGKEQAQKRAQEHEAIEYEINNKSRLLWLFNFGYQDCAREVTVIQYLKI